MNTAPKRCTRKHNQQDEISQLPREILSIVLSRLSLKEAVATSVLSSQWLHLWKFTSRLNFDATKTLFHVNENRSLSEGERAKYVEWVNQVLMSHEGLVLEEFRVCFDLDNVYQKDIDNWLKFAVARQVQRLNLTLSLDYTTLRNGACYTFPNEVVAEINGGFKSLRELSLTYVNVTAELLHSFLSNCPLLERLTLVATRLLTNFEVCGPYPNLRYLNICRCDDLDLFKVCNTNLISINYLGIGRCVLHNNPSLVDLQLGYTNWLTFFFPEPSRVMSQLKHLTVCSTNVENLLGLQELRMPRLKLLKVYFFVQNNGSLLGFSPLVKAAPFLQKVVLEFSPCCFLPNDFDGRSIEKPPTCPHHQIKEVVLKGYTGCVNNLQVVMYFLQNALALEQLVIDPHLQLHDDLDPNKINEREEASRKLAKQQIEKISPLHPQVKISIL